MSHANLKPYSCYNDSGIEWLGQIPAHWEVTRLKYAASIHVGMLDRKPDDAIYIGLENIEPWTGRFLLNNQAENVDGIVASFDAGDVLFGKLRPYLAKSARPDFCGVASSEIIALRPVNQCSQSYLMYCLLNKPYIRWIDTLTYGARMPRVSPDQVGGSVMPLPPPPEQRAIAAFLDRETARIDALVAKQERLIELLRAKRAALISQAVTCEDWPVVKLHRLISRVSRPVNVRRGSTYREIGIRSWGKGIFHKEPTTGASLAEKRVFYVNPGDLVLNIVFAWEGAVAVVSEHERGMIASHRFPTFDHVHALADLDYLLMFLQSEHGRALMSLNSPGRGWSEPHNSNKHVSGRGNASPAAERAAEDCPGV